MKKVRLGIMGVGTMGTVHANKIIAGEVPEMELAGLYDPNAARYADFPGIPSFATANELIHAEGIDAILIATPHYDHTPLGIEVLQAGKHLMVEKPISVHKADCERLIQAHVDKRVIFSAMFNQRTDPRYQKLKELIESGELGAIRRIVWIITDWFRTEFYYASGGWRATWRGEGGGVLLNQCPHQLDLWQWLFGMPQKLRAFCDIGRYHQIEVEDDVTCYMEYANGCKGVFITTTGEAPGTNRLEVTAENGKLIIEGDSEGIQWTRNEQGMSAWSKTCQGGFTKPPVTNIDIPIEGEKGRQHVGILQNFASAILHGEKLIAPAEEGIRSVELANAMLFSSFRDTTLELPIDAAAYEALLKKKIAESTFEKGETHDSIAADFDHS